jgi:hypothetical protein
LRALSAKKQKSSRIRKSVLKSKDLKWNDLDLNLKIRNVYDLEVQQRILKPSNKHDIELIRLALTKLEVPSQPHYSWIIHKDTHSIYK